MIKSLILLLASSAASASTFVYTVTLNTSSISATAGTIDFQFNPGDFTSDIASAAISNFQIAGPGSLTGPPQYFGAASGTLPSSLVVANANNDNEALQALTFGTALSFRVTLSELLTGTATTGSVFNFGAFKSDGITPLLTTDPSGFSASVNLDNAGGSRGSTTTPLAAITPVPEPGTMVLMIVGISGLVAAWKHRRLA